MNIPLWVSELAADFWRDADDATRFPRDLRASIPRVLPLSVFLIADLSLGRLQDWLQKNGVDCQFDTRDRRLRGGLIARQGHGIAFIDGGDSDAEQRFSLAHELAHFLRDYWRPRRNVESRLGVAALDAVDGLRPATAQERFQSLVRLAPLGFHLHLLDRDAHGNPAAASIVAAEEDADRLAYELLAPCEHILETIPDWRDRSALQEMLVAAYGFPRAQAVRYAAVLLPAEVHADPLLKRLKLLT